MPSGRRSLSRALVAVVAIGLVAVACTAARATPEAPRASGGPLPTGVAIGPTPDSPQPTPTLGCGMAPIYAVVRRPAPADKLELACSAIPPVPGNWAVRPKGAADAARSFLGVGGSLPVTGPYYDQNRVAWFVVSDRTAVIVDATTGEVAAVYHYDERTVAVAAEPSLSKARVTQIAGAYLEAHRVEVGGLEVHVEPSYWGYVVRWERLERGVAVFPRIEVIVDWSDGAVREFHADRRPFARPAAAKVSREAATRAAVAAARAEYGAASRSVEWAELEVARAGDGTSQTLRWRIVLHAPSQDSDRNPYLTIAVDAVTGDAEVIG